MTDPKPDLDELLSQAIAAADPDISQRIATDPSAYLDLVVLAERANVQTAGLLRSAVRSARTAGHSWDAIGQVLGMSRQAAQQRFGRPDPEMSIVEGEERTLTPLTAANEMEELDRYGRHGWHSVGFGILFHTMRHSPWQWEHQRVYVLGHSRRAMETEGWQRIGRLWFPWAYYKRQTDRKALPEPVATKP